jgi:hypothetical protein
MTHRTATLPLVAAPAACALALTLAAAPASAQMTGVETGVETGEDPAGETVYNRIDAEMSPLEKAVRSELADIGVASLSVDKYSSEQLAAILLTLTNQDGANPDERENAVEMVMQRADSHDGPTRPDEVAGNDTVRDAVEDALGRAGWTADVSQLTDTQVAALFDILADAGNLETQRIEEVLP